MNDFDWINTFLSLYDFQSFPASFFIGFGEFWWSKPTQIIVARIWIDFLRRYIESLGFLQFFFLRDDLVISVSLAIHVACV